VVDEELSELGLVRHDPFARAFEEVTAVATRARARIGPRLAVALRAGRARVQGSRRAMNDPLAFDLPLEPWWRRALSLAVPACVGVLVAVAALAARPSREPPAHPVTAPTVASTALPVPVAPTASIAPVAPVAPAAPAVDLSFTLDEAAPPPQGHHRHARHRHAQHRPHHRARHRAHHRAHSVARR
jgi:hypothetical protein